MENEKKYWIKDLTEKQCIHAPTREIADKLLSKFHELGLTWSTGFTYLEKDLWGINTSNTIYIPTKGCYSNALFYSVKDYEVLTIDQLYDFDNEEKTFPRNMLVTGAPKSKLFDFKLKP